MTDRQEARLITLIRVHTWKIKQEYNAIASSTIYRKDLEKYIEEYKKVIRNKLDIFTNKTQLEYFSNQEHVEDIEERLKQLSKVALWEIAIFPEATISLEKLKYANNTPLSKEDVIDFKKTQSNALGINTAANSLEKNIDINHYKNEIATILGKTVYDLEHIFYDIKKTCEYSSVLGTIKSCVCLRELPQRDRKEIYINKQKFEAKKNQTIENLKFFKLPYDDVEKVFYTSDEDKEWINYQMTLKHIKEVLYSDLTRICSTGKRRAKAITKILEYIKL